MSESTLMRQAMIAVSRAGSRVFRNNVAMAWVGEAQKVARFMTVKVGPGDVVIRNARPLHAGLCDGSSDLIGFTPVEVRPEHVGSKLAVFTAIETKSQKGRVTPEQKNFVAQVNASGGLAGVAYSIDEAVAIVTKIPGL